MGRADKDSPLTGIISGRRNRSLEFMARKITRVQSSETKGLTPDQRRLIQRWSEHPWNFLTGLDTDGTPIYWTKDERDSSAPLKPFPGGHHPDAQDKPFLRAYIQVLHERDKVFVDKARQLYISTATLAFISWNCTFTPGRRWLLSKSTEEEAVELIRDKVREPFRHMPEWFQAWAGLKDKPENRAIWTRSGSTLSAVTENVSDRKARGGTASGVLVDEAAFQSQFAEMIRAMFPMTEKFFAVSTANMGNAGADEFRRYIQEDGDEKAAARVMASR